MANRPGARSREARERWQRCLTRQVASGLSQKAFCEREGLNASEFSRWKRRLRGETPAESGPASWLELAPPRSEALGSWDIELDLGNGVCLRLRQS
jgi:hypothetical protein